MSNEKTENRAFWEEQENLLDRLVYKATWPGGQEAVNRLAKQGKQLVRDLIRKLIDPETQFFELNRITGFGVNYPDVKDVPCGGLVAGLGRIHGNWTMIIANDSRVKAGTYFPITLKKHMRAQAIAERCGVNCVYIADSGGAYLPMQADVFPDDQHSGSCSTTWRACRPWGLSRSRSNRRQHGGRRIYRFHGLRIDHDRQNVL